MLSNVRSLENKLDLIQLSWSTQHETFCVFVSTETWLYYKFMVVKCWTLYLPWEFKAIVIVAVYIPPCANAKDALHELYSTISEQQTNNPDGFFIIVGDFNQANLKTVFPKFYQHVNFATRGNRTLDFVYTTVKNAYKLNLASTSGTRTTSLLG